MRPLARAAAVLVCGTASLAGCAGVPYSLRDEIRAQHLFRWDHTWHALPARIGYEVGSFPAHLFGGIEAVLQWKDPVHDGDGVTNRLFGYVGAGLGYLLGGPFYVLGLPFEPSEDETVSPKAASPPMENDSGKDP